MDIRSTQFTIGQVVRHRHYPFRGVIIKENGRYVPSLSYFLVPVDVIILIRHLAVSYGQSATIFSSCAECLSAKGCRRPVLSRQERSKAKA
ncbi:MAG: hypothetical protein JSU67_14250 [Gammaproteobacteria bacterium]|nr:MAG: hypothetical protein JSU67_14250 [Gammaproteobacteria bacterium]